MSGLIQINTTSGLSITEWFQDSIIFLVWFLFYKQNQKHLYKLLYYSLPFFFIYFYFFIFVEYPVVLSAYFWICSERSFLVASETIWEIGDWTCMGLMQDKQAPCCTITWAVNLLDFGLRLFIICFLIIKIIVLWMHFYLYLVR